MNPPKPIFVTLRIVFAIIGLCVGISVFASFVFKFDNLQAGIWGLASGIMAGVVLYVHLMYHRKFWQDNFEALRAFFGLACFMSLVSIIAFVTYLILACVLNVEFSVYGTNYWVVLVWVFMTAKWSLALFFYSRQYYCVYAGTDGFRCMFGIRDGEEEESGVGTPTEASSIIRT